MSNPMHRYMLRERGVDEMCPQCKGAGVVHDGPTWIESEGGPQPTTTEVCDECWGSGDKNHHWPSHKLFYSMKRKCDEGW